MGSPRLAVNVARGNEIESDDLSTHGMLYTDVPECNRDDLPLARISMMIRDEKVERVSPARSARGVCWRK